MSHSISLFLINKSELRDFKIDNLISDKKSNINWIELNENIFATIYIPNIEDFGSNRTIAKITTDYFGGFGHQTAKLFTNNKKVYDGSDEYHRSKNYKSNPINEVLKLIGVERKDNMDEFDTVGLGKIRSNYDL